MMNSRHSSQVFNVAAREELNDLPKRCIYNAVTVSIVKQCEHLCIQSRALQILRNMVLLSMAQYKTTAAPILPDWSYHSLR